MRHRLRSRLAAVSLLAGLWGAPPSQAAVIPLDPPPLTLLGVASAIASPDCLEYCFTGLCVFVHCTLTPPSCTIRTSPKVEHYNPDLVVSAYNLEADGASGNPWTEVRASLGLATKTVAATLLGTLTGVVPGSGSATLSPGRTVDLRHKEVDVIGHPLAKLGSLAATSGSAGGASTTPPGSPASLGSQSLSDISSGASSVASVSSTVSTAASWGSIVSPVAGQIASAANTVFSAASTLSTLANTASTLSTLSSAAGVVSGVFGGAGIRFFCTSEATPFMPYYLSAVDPIAWRFNIPEMLYPAALVPGLREIGKPPFLVPPGHTWGHVYPRSGAVAQGDDRKAAAVAAQRAVDVVTRRRQPHVYLPLTGPTGNGVWSPGGVLENTDNHKWQMLYPAASTSCTRFGSTPGWPTAEWTERKGNYAWILWRKYGCCMSRLGVFVGSISVPRICLT
ncbi:MAG: TIGR03756 family integrating conjugative element protein [Gammaproteobacteria bacterium]|nr:TIGR03756 family integrating conjugative element protein [Gammaproteobacteria bacterium]